jgi:uncharacterized protein
MNKYTWKEAFAQAHEAVRMGSPGAQNFVGYCYDFGRGVRRDLKRHTGGTRERHGTDRLTPSLNLAVMNGKGQGIHRNAARAVRLYQRAAVHGDLQSQANLAVMPLDGDGIKQDTVNGLAWLRRAAKRGDDKAQYSLALAYLDGNGVPQNKAYAKAIIYLAKSFKDFGSKIKTHCVAVLNNDLSLLCP